MSKKLFSVGISYMTRKGNLGSKAYEIEARDHEHALKKARKKANKKGRSKFSGDCVEISFPTFIIEAVNNVCITELYDEDQECFDEITTPYETQARNEEEALDYFHCNIPIACLDHFDITCKRQ